MIARSFRFVNIFLCSPCTFLLYVSETLNKLPGKWQQYVLWQYTGKEAFQMKNSQNQNNSQNNNENRNNSQNQNNSQNRNSEQNNSQNRNNR